MVDIIAVQATVENNCIMSVGYVGKTTLPRYAP